MRVIAVDPGPEQSAWVVYVDGKIIGMDIEPNQEAAESIAAAGQHGLPMAVEMIASYGMAVGKDVFETCVWIGRFIESHEGGSFCNGAYHEKVYRKDVKLHLCGSPRAKDANIRQALIDRFGPGKEKAIGTKKSPGPLYGVKSHLWAALAVAVTYCDKKEAEAA